MSPPRWFSPGLSATLAVLLAACGGEEDVASRVVGTRRVRTVLPAGAGDSASPSPSVRLPSGTRIVSLDDAGEGGEVCLTDGLDAAGFPVATLDGGGLLFTARERATDRFSAWRCAADGSDRRKLVEESGDLAAAAELPDGRIVYAAEVPGGAVLRGMGSAWALFVRAPGEGSGARITFSAGCDVLPTVLPDGRIRYLAYDVRVGGFAPYVAHPDGTGVSADRRGSSASPATHRSARLGVAREVQGHLSMLRPQVTHGDLLGVDGRAPGSAAGRRVRLRALSGPFVGGREPSSRTLGDVALAEDGSFFVRVPADEPLLLDLLDERGEVVVPGRTPFWVRPGEVRGCVGCHAGHTGPEVAPPNRRPLAARAAPQPLFGEEGGR